MACAMRLRVLGSGLSCVLSLLGMQAQVEQDACCCTLFLPYDKTESNRETGLAHSLCLRLDWVWGCSLLSPKVQRWQTFPCESHSQTELFSLSCASHFPCLPALLLHSRLHLCQMGCPPQSFALDPRAPLRPLPAPLVRNLSNSHGHCIGGSQTHLLGAARPGATEGP